MKNDKKRQKRKNCTEIFCTFKYFLCRKKVHMAYYSLYGYKKYYKDGETGGSLTGTALLSNMVPELVIIDVDNKGKTVNEQQSIYK